jgi:hypothetical protein
MKDVQILRHFIGKVIEHLKLTEAPPPNDVRERRGPAATDVRIVSELNGWSSSAPRNSSAFSRSLGVPAGCKTAGNE